MVRRSRRVSWSSDLRGLRAWPVLAVASIAREIDGRRPARTALMPGAGPADAGRSFAAARALARGRGVSRGSVEAHVHVLLGAGRSRHRDRPRPVADRRRAGRTSRRATSAASRRSASGSERHVHRRRARLGAARRRWWIARGRRCGSSPSGCRRSTAGSFISSTSAPARANGRASCRRSTRRCCSPAC